MTAKQMERLMRLIHNYEINDFDNINEWYSEFAPIYKAYQEEISEKYHRAEERLGYIKGTLGEKLPAIQHFDKVDIPTTVRHLVTIVREYQKDETNDKVEIVELLEELGYIYEAKLFAEYATQATIDGLIKAGILAEWIPYWQEKNYKSAEDVAEVAARQGRPIEAFAAQIMVWFGTMNMEEK